MIVSSFLFCFILICFGQNENIFQVDLNIANACYESITEKKQQFAVKYESIFQEYPPAIRAVGRVRVQRNGSIIQNAGTSVEYHFKLIPTQCTKTLSFGANNNQYPDSDLLFAMGLYTPKSYSPFSVIEFTAKPSLPDGTYKFRDNETYLNIILKIDPSFNHFLLPEPTIVPDYMESLTSETYNGKCVCALYEGKKFDLRLVDGTQIMPFDSQYGNIEFELLIEAADGNDKELYSVLMAAFPCRCLPEETLPIINLVIPSNLTSATLTVSLSNIDGGLETMGVWTISGSNTEWQPNDSAFSISNMVVIRPTPENRRVNAPNNIYMFKFKEETEVCGFQRKITTLKKTFNDAVYEFQFSKAAWTEPGKLLQELSVKSGYIGICDQF